MKEQVKVINGEFHKIDKAGNHFINNKCVNPTCVSGGNIGDTYPEEITI
tara:strand:+ start:316 stop:462 length:147 start_codon:yes stop_codon:yes gene_type:complete